MDDASATSAVHRALTVYVGGASAQLIHHYQRAVRDVGQQIGALLHLREEGAEIVLHVVCCAQSSEDAVADRHAGVSSRHEAAHLSQHHQR